MRHAVYGLLPADLAEVPADAAQVSPLIPGSARLEDLPAGSLEAATLLAPPGTVERRHALALALRALAPGGRLTALAPKDRGGARLAKELAALGCAAADLPKRHHRICTGARPADLGATVAAAVAAGAPRHAEGLGLWTQPGVFSWDRTDPGTALLVAHLPPLKGRGADLGCGLGALALTVLASPAVSALALVDLDRRAVEMARRNVADPRATVLWADVRAAGAVPDKLDFAVTNPPFHDGGAEDQALGRAFIAAAARALRPGGALWLVANAHLPYGPALEAAFRSASVVAQADGYRVYEARK